MRILFVVVAFMMLAGSSWGQGFEKTVFNAPGSGYFTRYEWVDFNADGSFDILEIDSYGAGALYIAQAEGFAGFSINLENVRFDENRYAFRDQDGDGDVDILASRGNSLVILKYNGSDGFSLIETGIQYTDVDYGPIYWLDIDGDHIPDIIHNRKILLNRDGNYHESTFVFPELLSNMVFDDLDGDGLTDLVSGGYDSYDGTDVTVYLNQGSGVFSSTGVTLPENRLKSQTLALFDADRDGDVDIFVTDWFARGLVFTNSLVQNGQMTFAAHQIFENISLSRATAGDINADGLQDIVFAGSTSLNILTNTSSGGTISFTRESHELSMDQLFSFGLVDVDKDNDLDISVKGRNWDGDENLVFLKTGTSAGLPPSAPTGLSALITKDRKLSWTATPGLLYNVELKRNGAPYLPSATSLSKKLLVPGSTLLRTGTLQLRGIPAGSYEWRVQAIDPSGRASQFSTTSTFNIKVGPTALTLSASDLTKVRLCWQYSGPGTPSFSVFRNSANGSLTEIAQIPSGTLCYDDTAVPANQAVEYFVVAIEGGVYSARSNTVKHHSSVFVKTQFGTSDPNIISSRCFPADYDADGDYDLAFFGRVGSWHNNFLLKNDGTGKFSPFGPMITNQSIIIPYTEMQGPRDLDNDGDPDLVLIVGESYSWQKVAVFINDAGTFVKTFETPEYLGVAQLGIEDFNNDGRPDLLFSHVIGNSPGNPQRIKLLLQTGTVGYEDSHIVFSSEETTNTNYFRYADLNDDGFTDILWTSAEGDKMKIQVNEGGMAFTWKSSTLPATTSMGIDDYNGDGYIDIITQGNEGLHLYSGQGDFTFSDPKVIPIGHLSGSSTYTTADIDLDGLSDILISDGYNSHIMLNKGNGSFKSSDVELQRDWGTSIAITDIDNDGDIDIVKPGNDGQHQGLNYLYENQIANIQITNQPPSHSGGVSVAYSSGKAVFSWAAGTDDHTPAELLTYNLRVTDSNGKVWLSSETNDAGTFRRRLAPGNSGHSTTRTLNNLPAGTYTARVQAVDASFALSTWSAASPFTIEPGPTALAVERILLTKVKLTWTGSAFSETSVLLERKTTDTEWAVIATLPAGSTSFTDETLEYNKLYQYRVFESSASKTTAMSNVAEWNSALWAIADTEIANIWGSLDIADFTGDGRMDFVLNGGMIYNGYYEDITRATFENTTEGWIKRDLTPSDLNHTAQISFTDLNGDARQDIFQHGYIWGTGYRTETFQNNGDKTFSTVSNLFTNQTYSIQSYFDFDMDNDQDIAAISMANESGVRAMLKNNGDGNFQVVQCNSCTDTQVVADFDRDGDEDVIRNSGGSFILYLNTPAGLVATGASFPSYDNRVAVADYNDDGLPDVILLTSSSYHGGKIYRNLGVQEGSATPAFSPLPLDLSSGDMTLRFADFDHDGHTDLVVLSPYIKVLLNDGNGMLLPYQIPGYRIGLNHAGIVDFDNDGDLDIYISGYHLRDFSDYGRKAKILLNQIIVSGKGVANAPPAAPTGLISSQDSLGMTLTWSTPADDHTQGLTYDVVLYHDGKPITKGAHDPFTGNRVRLAPGRSSGKAVFNNLLLGSYTWRVQAVDASFAGSPLSIEGTFTFVPPPPVINDTTIYRCGRNVTLTALGTNIEWYADKNLTQLIASGSFHPVKSQTVYVVQNIDGYRGIAKHVTITIIDKPDAPTLMEPNPVIICAPAAGYRSVWTVGENVHWYSDEQLTNLLAVGNGAQLPASIEKSYFATQVIGGCQGIPLRVDVKLVDLDPRIYFTGTQLWTTATEGDSFTWYKNGFLHAQTTVPHIPFDGETASYIVAVSKGLCFEVSDPFISSEENITGVEDFSQVAFEMYPNPASARLTLRAKTANTNMQIFDARGKLVYSFGFTHPGEEIIDTSRWNKGMYLVMVDDGKNSSARRLVLH